MKTLEKKALLESIARWKSNIIEEEKGNTPMLGSFWCPLCIYNADGYTLSKCMKCILTKYGFRCTKDCSPYSNVVYGNLESFWNMYNVLLLVALSEGVVK